MVRPTIARRIVLGVGSAWLFGLVALALVVRQGAPGPAGQVVQGVGIGSHGGPAGMAYLSGRELRCAPTTRAPYTAHCTAEVAGRTLELFARRNPPGDSNQLGGACEAVYAGRTWPCRIGSRHVHVHWFAYLAEPLGLTPAELDAVRRARPFPNAPEEPFMAALLVVPVITGLLAAGAASAWVRVAGQGWVTAAAAAIFTAPVAWLCALFLAARATNGFWD